MKDPFTAMLEWRRKHVSDRRWIGCGMVVGGLLGGLLAPGPWLWRALGGAIVLVGLCLLRPWIVDVIRMGRAPGPGKLGPLAVAGLVLLVMFVPWKLPWERSTGR